jgi:hypothetical protein
MFAFLSHPLIAHHPSHLTVDWAQHIVNQHSTSTTVTHVKIISVDIGTTTRIRITVSYDGAGSLPNHWFIKIPSLSWRARAITALPRLLHTEIRFYNELANRTPTVKPTVLSAKSQLARGSTLVLNNTTEQGGVTGNPSHALTAGQARLIIEQLASLHAKFWNKTNNNPKLNWLAGPVRQLEDHLGTALAVPLMKRGLKKAGNLVPEAIHAPAIHYARHRRKAMRFLAQDAQTIVHHDCHPGNLFWHDEKPGLLDWQMVRIGEGIGDIAYFLATSLEPAIRKKNENQLITHYIETLKNLGISNINSEQMFNRYKAHLTYPFEAMLVTLAIGDMMDLKANQLLIERVTSAILDNNAFDALPL